MKLLFVISSLDFGGAQRALSNIVCNLPKEYEISILLNDSANIVYPYRGEIHSLNIQTDGSRMGVVYQSRVFIRKLRKLRKLKKSGDYDWCISFLESSNFANILTGRKHCGTIVSCRAHLSRQSQVLPIYRYIVGPLVRVLYNKADLIVAVSRGIKKDLIDNYGLLPSKISVIYNGFDIPSITKQFQDIKNADTLAMEGRYTIVSAGRLDIQKGQWHLIKAFSKFSEICENSQLIILGDGPLKRNLFQLAEELGIREKVTLMGFVNNPFDIISRSDIFVLPSLYEGFPNALVEAMICGIPVIASDCETGVREILAPNTDLDMKLACNSKTIEQGEYGIIVSCGCDSYSTQWEENEEAIYTAMKMLCYDSALSYKYAKQGYERASELSIKRVVKDWEKVLCRV